MGYRALPNADRHSMRLSEQKWLKRRASAGVWIPTGDEINPSILFVPPRVRRYTRVVELTKHGVANPAA